MTHIYVVLTVAFAAVMAANGVIFLHEPRHIGPCTSSELGGPKIPQPPYCYGEFVMSGPPG